MSGMKKKNEKREEKQDLICFYVDEF